MHEIVQDYYGNQLKHTDDLKTNACCDTNVTPSWLKRPLSRIHPEILSRYYGCGLVCPPLLEGCRVLDLGCGSGRDVYLLSQLVGKSGEVIGVDMTDEQLTVANKYQDFHSDTFGYKNVSFLKGYIEHLDKLNLEPNSFDVIVSNCVINLSPDKDAVLNGINLLLKEGGEFYFSDVYADRRVPTAVRNDPVLYGECLGGALYWNDFLQLTRRHGFVDPRLVTDKPILITNPELALRIGDLNFFSATYRLFKLKNLETSCEDYAQAVIYLGNIPEHADQFIFDKYHNIERGKKFPVSGNTWRMLHDTRYVNNFNFIGDFSGHLGAFPSYGSNMPFDTTANSKIASKCC